MTDTKLKFGEMLFEWDEEKNKINRQKHGVDFNDAAMIFQMKTALKLLTTYTLTKRNVGRLSAKLKIFYLWCILNAEILQG